MSAATSIGRRLFFSSQRANLPTVVVLPEPWRPTIMIEVGPFLAQSTVVSTGPISSTSFSWQMRMKCCSGVAETARSPALARSFTEVPSASSFTRSRKVLVTLNSTSASRSDMRTSRSASSMLSSFSSATPVSRALAFLKPLERVSSMQGPYHGGPLATIERGGARGMHAQTAGRRLVAGLWELPMKKLVPLMVVLGCSDNNISTNMMPPAAQGLVARVDIVTDATDATLVNAWGLAFNPAGVAWVSAAETGVSEVYDHAGRHVIPPVVIPAPGGGTSAPTGQAFNGDAGIFMGDRFIFVTE